MTLERVSGDFILRTVGSLGDILSRGGGETDFFKIKKYGVTLANRTVEVSGADPVLQDLYITACAHRPVKSSSFFKVHSRSIRERNAWREAGREALGEAGWERARRRGVSPGAGGERGGERPGNYRAAAGVRGAGRWWQCQHLRAQGSRAPAASVMSSHCNPPTPPLEGGRGRAP